MAIEFKLTNVAVDLKSAGAGLARPTFSTFNVLDHDGDVVLPGAIQDGVTVPISGYNHASWQPGNLPVGKATIRSLPDRAEADAQFFMNTINGADTFTTLKELGGSQWSYGYDVLDSEFGDFQGKRARFLKKMTVHELSPVLLAASVGTGTANIRSASAARIDDVGKRLLAAVAAKHGYRSDTDATARDQLAAEYLRFMARKVQETRS